MDISLGLLKNTCWIDLPSFEDSRGILTPIESGIDVPFDIKRIFFMYEISDNRGGHAHRETEQVAIAVSGAFKFQLSDADNTQTYCLDNPAKGLYLPPMVFLDEIVQDTPGSVCIVLASTHYDDENYIRDYSDYLEAAAALQG